MAAGREDRISPRRDADRPWWHPAPPDGPVLLRVRVTPKAGADRVLDLTETPDGPALRVQVRAAPSDGAANEAVITTVAKSLRRAKTTITLAAGAKGRNKTLALVPLPGTLEALEALTSSQGANSASPPETRRTPPRR